MDVLLQENLAPFVTWYWLATVAIMTVVGQFTSTRLFTRQRAYNTADRAQWFWWWGRESLPLHPILTGLLLGAAWVDPGGAGWSRYASMAYFGAAGCFSLFAWMILRGYLKKRGIEVRLPGSTYPPPSK